MKHLFALYAPTLPSELVTGTVIDLRDKELLQRITTVLRLKLGEELILFNGTEQIVGRLESTTKCTLTVVESSATLPLAPAIHFYPGLLKKAAFEEVMYAAAALGVTSVTPAMCHKMHKEAGRSPRASFNEVGPLAVQAFGTRERERGQKVMVAACEQAKSFVLPELNEAVSFDAIIAQASGLKIYFDPTGAPALEWLHSTAANSPEAISVVCGPEAGLSEHEMKMLDEADFVKVALTPTILKAEHAAWVGLGLLRSCLGR